MEEKHITRTIIMSGLALDQLAAVIKKMHLFITNDTGPMHIAAAVDVPVVALFGPMDAARYRPYTTEDKAAVIQKDVDCVRPCELHECDDLKCMKSITAKEVFELAQKFIDLKK